MKWSFQELRIQAQDPLAIDTSIEISDEMQERSDEILAMSPVKVDGFVIYEEATVLAQLQIALDVTLPSSRSLEPVNVSMAFSINERYLPKGMETDIIDDEAVLQIEVEGNSVDLTRAIEDNILLHLPQQRLTAEEAEEQELPMGKDWDMMTEDSYRSSLKGEEKIDPRLAKLKDLFADEASED
ncbi:YceD family protein [Aerococcus sanguinicola]|uniref:Nucleic acid-binding protein n=1 Tax=Aerococcus sanguinicola TaxID=119206 RepID=A0A0X8FA01_9LACT|nr:MULTISPECIES: YceD family protein [Aerococcus]AMB93509.1 hypothetical protein AWM72_01485 [Aerococcus sanguinicola]MDK7050726.1 YceD family protein [Aerococcus sanguinicola]OFT97551.1 hypothetical protein HMPREF3090_00620 [Aerococcus sp. HMSC23C02]